MSCPVHSQHCLKRERERSELQAPWSCDWSGPKLVSGHWLMRTNLVWYFGTETPVVAGCVSFWALLLTWQMHGWLNRQSDERRSFWGGGILLTADIGITCDWITIGFPTSNGRVHWRGKGDRRLGQIDMFVLALRGEKNTTGAMEKWVEWCHLCKAVIGYRVMAVQRRAQFYYDPSFIQDPQYKGHWNFRGVLSADGMSSKWLKCWNS